MIERLNQIADGWFAWQVSMLWQVAVLIAIVWAVDALIRKWAWPQVRYALWLLVIVKLLLPPTLGSSVSVTAEIPEIAKKAVTVQINRPKEKEETSQKFSPIAPGTFKPAQTNPQYSHAPASPATQDVTEAQPEPIIAATKPSGPTLSYKAYCLFAWLTGIALLTSWLLFRLASLRCEHLKIPGKALPERFRDILAEAAKKLKVKRLPRVILTDKVRCPAVFGLFRPVLLMPYDKLKTLTREDLEHILLHELAHIKRGDLYVHAAYMSLQIAYWFNPLLWLIRRPIQNLRELCCDATVARLLKDKTYSYRETLLETARQLLAEPVDPGLGLLGLFENSNRLLDRLNWLEKKTWKNRPLRLATIFIIIGLMLGCVLPMDKASQSDGKIDVPSEYIGHWNGQARIVVSWTKQKQLPIDIEIHSDGTVEGKIGDAELVNGKLIKKNWVYTKVFQHENPYRIEGNLQGEVIKSENIQRDSVEISLRVEDGKIDGGLTTTGKKTGTKETMKLFAMDVSLIKVDDNNANEVSGKSLRDVLIERRDMLQKKLQNLEQKSKAGLVDSKELQQAKIDLLRVESELAESPQKRIDILGQIVDLYKEQEKRTQQLLDAGRATQDEFDKAKLQRLEAEAELTKAKADASKQQSEFKATLSNGVTVELIGICEHPSEGKQWWRPDGSLLEDSPYDDVAFGRAFPKFGEKGYKFAVKFSHMAGKNIDAKLKTTNFKTTNGGALFSISEKNGEENIKYAGNSIDEKIIWYGVAFDENRKDCDIIAGVCFGDWQKDYKYETDKPNDGVEWCKFENVSLRPNFGLYVVLDEKQIILRESEDQARLLNHDYIGTEHILLALVAENSDVISDMSRHFGIDRKAIYDEVMRLVKKNRSYVHKETLPMTPHTQLSFEKAAQLAKEFNNNKVNSKHILLGILMVKDGVGAEALANLSLDFEKVSHVILGKENQESNFKTTLPNGVTVELLGICEHPSEGKQWWTPNGSFIEGRPYDHIGAEVRGGVCREFAVRLTNLPEDKIDHRWDFVPPASFAGGHHPDDKNGEQIKDIWAVAAAFNEAVEKATVKFGVAAGKWQTQVSFDGKGSTSIGQGNYAFNFAKPYVEDNHTYLTVSDNMLDFPHRVIAIDINGNIHESVDTSSGTAGEIRQSTFGFKNLAIENIQEFQFQIRPYRWVTFKNVSLKPGHKTNVEIENMAEELTEQDKMKVEDLVARGWHLWGQRKLYEAEELFKQAVEIDSADANAWNGLGWSQKNQGKNLNAAQSFEKCLKIRPDHPAALNGLGWIEKQKGNIDQAINYWQKAVESTPNATAALVGLTQTYTELEQYDKAKKYYQIWLDVDPGNTEAKKGLQEMNKLIEAHKTDVKTEVGESTDTVDGGGIDIKPSDFALRFDADRKVYYPVVSIRNDSDVTIPKFKLRFYRGDPEDNLNELGKEQSGWHEAGPIKPGDQWNERTAGFYLPDGTYTFSVVLDYDNAIAETDETNNKKSLNITIQDGQVTYEQIQLITFRPTGDFAPHTPGRLLKVFNDCVGFRVTTHHFRTEPRDGRLYGMILTDSRAEAAAIEKMLDESDTLEFVSFGALNEDQLAEHYAKEQLSLRDVKAVEATQSTENLKNDNVTEPGPMGQYALEFDGVDDYFEVQASKSLQLGRNFTIQMWIKPEFPDTGTPDKDRILLSKGGWVSGDPNEKGGKRASPYGFALRLEPNGKDQFALDMVTASKSGCYSSTNVFFLKSGWHHLVIVSGEFSGMSRGVNRIRTANKDYYEPAPKSNLFVGDKYLIPMGNPFKGQIAELRIWNKPLSSDEIETYKQMPLTGDEPNLVACWSFDEIHNGQAIDKGPYRNHGRLGSKDRDDKFEPKKVKIES